MTPIGPQKPAPRGTPEAVALFLDDAAARLRPFIEAKGLTIKPYEIVDRPSGTWAHNLYGQAGTTRFAIQLAVHPANAPHFSATVTGYVRDPSEGDPEWMQITSSGSDGMARMLAAVEDALRRLRLACGFKSAYARFPDAQA